MLDFKRRNSGSKGASFIKQLNVRRIKDKKSFDWSFSIMHLLAMCWLLFGITFIQSVVYKVASSLCLRYLVRRPTNQVIHIYIYIIISRKRGKTSVSYFSLTCGQLILITLIIRLNMNVIYFIWHIWLRFYEFYHVKKDMLCQ